MSTHSHAPVPCSKTHPRPPCNSSRLDFASIFVEQRGLPPSLTWRKGNLGRIWDQKATSEAVFTLFYVFLREVGGRTLSERSEFTRPEEQRRFIIQETAFNAGYEARPNES